MTKSRNNQNSKVYKQKIPFNACYKFIVIDRMEKLKQVRKLMCYLYFRKWKWNISIGTRKMRFSFYLIGNSKGRERGEITVQLWRFCKYNVKPYDDRQEFWKKSNNDINHTIFRIQFMADNSISQNLWQKVFRKINLWISIYSLNTRR